MTLSHDWKIVSIIQLRNRSLLSCSMNGELNKSLMYKEIDFYYINIIIKWKLK